MRKILLLTLGLIATVATLQAQVGSWRAYPAYHDITAVEKGGNTLYVLASGGLYTYNTADRSVQTFDKTNALSGTDISFIAWCQAARRLVIVYQDQNIDLMDDRGQVSNLPDYYLKSMTEDKTVNDVHINGTAAYLSTNFGILKIDVARAEVSDTYNLAFPVAYCRTEGGNIYAASPDAGLYAAPLTSNLPDKASWTRRGDYTPQHKTIDPALLAEAQQARADGPKYNNFGFLRFENGTLYTSCGPFIDTNDRNLPGCVQTLTGRNWTIYEDDLGQKTGYTYVDVGCVAVDPKDKTHVFAGGRSGLYEFHDGLFLKAYTNTNSPLQTAWSVADRTNRDYVIVQGLQFTPDGSLWCLNSMSTSAPLLRLDASGEWTEYPHPELMYGTQRALENLTGMTTDSRGLLWFVNNHYRMPALVAYQPQTDKLNAYKNFVNQDGTRVQVGYVRCVAEDREGNIWAGTDHGPLLLRAADVTTDAPVFYQVKVPRNDNTNLADYLLDGVDITSVAIDGANRKWFGTNGSGVYLISADNLTQLQHFTMQNSPLLTDFVESIAIDSQSGEVFFGTEKGLCSYMSDATATADHMDKDSVYAYPNPVRPDYTGLITITGLSYNADVKIVTSSGTLVAEGRSNGGTYTWDGLDRRGRRVASGVYMVQTATAEGDKGTVCKIAVVR